MLIRLPVLAVLCLMLLPLLSGVRAETVPVLTTADNNELVIALDSTPVHFNPAILSGSTVGSVGAQLCWTDSTGRNGSACPLPRQKLDNK